MTVPNIFAGQAGPIPLSQLDGNFTALGSSANISFTQPNILAVEQTAQNKMREVVSFKDFGAVGDGITDDTSAVKAALESGHIVDGGGLTYAINGTCSPTSMVGLRNANFIQIGNNAIANMSVLSIVGVSDFFIDNVNINMGSNITTLFSDDGNSGLKVWGNHSGVNTTYITNFRISNVVVTGNGCGAGIHIRHAKFFIVDSCLIHDRISGSNPDPTNDSQNGLGIVNCANFTLANSQVHNLQTRISYIDSAKFTRGFLFAEVRDCTIVGCISTSVDQGYDFSGSYSAADGYTGNRRFTISACVANDCLTYGFKFANVTRDGLVSACIANNTGTIGFVFSPSAVAITGYEQYNTQNISVVGCKVVNVLGNGWSGSGAQGFRVMNNGVYTNYPRAISFTACTVVDTQSTPTTLEGFVSDAAPIVTPTAGYNTNIANYTSNCTVGIGVATPYNGIGPYICDITGLSTQSIASGTYTLISWDRNITDPTGLHSTSTTNSAITIKSAGWYHVQVQIQYESNATGSRNIRLYKNGTVVDRTTAVFAAISGMASWAGTSNFMYLLPGDYIEVGAYQNSGGVLNVLTNQSHFTLAISG